MALALVLAGTALTGDGSAAQERPRNITRQREAASENRGAAAAGLPAGAESFSGSGGPGEHWGQQDVGEAFAVVGAPGKSAAGVSGGYPKLGGDAKQPPPARKPRMRVTAYCPCSKCCDSYATVPMSQRMIGGGSIRLYPLIRDNVGFVAAPPSLPIGTRLIIPGYHGGRPVKVLDRGGDIQGQHLDVFMPTHRQALAWGSRMLTITVCP